MSIISSMEPAAELAIRGSATTTAMHLAREIADVFDFDTRLSRQPFGVLAQLIAERLGEMRIVENGLPQRFL